jgi:hypothetical protein
MKRRTHNFFNFGITSILSGNPLLALISVAGSRFIDYIDYVLAKKKDIFSPAQYHRDTHIIEWFLILFIYFCIFPFSSSHLFYFNDNITEFFYYIHGHILKVFPQLRTFVDWIFNATQIIVRKELEPTATRPEFFNYIPLILLIFLLNYTLLGKSIFTSIKRTKNLIINILSTGIIGLYIIYSYRKDIFFINSQIIYINASILNIFSHTAAYSPLNVTYLECISAFIFGICLHVLLDIFTPLGVPSLIAKKKISVAFSDRQLSTYVLNRYVETTFLIIGILLTTFYIYKLITYILNLL